MRNSPENARFSVLGALGVLLVRFLKRKPPRRQDHKDHQGSAADRSFSSAVARRWTHEKLSCKRDFTKMQCSSGQASIVFEDNAFVKSLLLSASNTITENRSHQISSVRIINWKPPFQGDLKVRSLRGADRGRGRPPSILMADRCNRTFRALHRLPNSREALILGTCCHLLTDMRL